MILIWIENQIGKFAKKIEKYEDYKIGGKNSSGQQFSFLRGGGQKYFLS